MKTYREINELRKAYTEASNLKISDRLTLYVDIDEMKYNLCLEDSESQQTIYITLVDGVRLFETLSKLEIPEANSTTAVQEKEQSNINSSTVSGKQGCECGTILNNYGECSRCGPCGWDRRVSKIEE